MDENKNPYPAPERLSDQPKISQIIWAYKDESFYARQNRMNLNALNWDCYHLRTDYTGKTKGQSREFLPKMSQSVEQITSFLQQGLMDQGDWFRIEPEYGVDVEKALIKPKEMELLTLRQIQKSNFPNYMQDALKLGLIGSLMVAKIEGKHTIRSSFTAKGDESESPLVPKKKLVRIDKKLWQADLSLVRQEDWFPDPMNDGLYQVQRVELDFHVLLAMALESPDVFDVDAVHAVNAYIDDMQKMKKSRETAQNATYNTFRKRVTLFECWGDLVDQVTGEVLYADCQAVIAMDGSLVIPPRKNPFWHGKSPYVVSPILRVPHSVWHKAMMDAPSQLNFAQNELFNLMVDGGMGAVFGVRQLRTEWLEDPTQIADGIEPGITLKVNSQCPPGMKVMERVDTGALPEEAIQMYNIVDREFQQSSFTNDTRMGSLPQRQVKATEIASANQTITGVFNGIVKTIETEFVSEILERTWLTSAQYMDDLDEEEIKDLLGEDRARMIANLQPEERFAATASGHKFNVFGLSQTLNKIQDFRKITSLMQSIGTSPALMQEFQKEYSMTKLLGEIIKSLDIDEQKIKATPEELQQVQEQQAQAQAQAQAEAQGKAGGAPNTMSQVKQMSATTPEDGSQQPPTAVLNQGMTQP